MTPANGIRLEDCTPEDRHLVRNVVLAALGQAGLTPDDPDLALLEDLPASVTAAGGSCLALHIGESICGSVAGRPSREYPGSWNLCWIALLPDWRGMGLGRQLGETLRDRAAEAGARAMRVALPARLSPLAGFFNTLGFREADPLADDGLCLTWRW